MLRGNVFAFLILCTVFQPEEVDARVTPPAESSGGVDNFAPQVATRLGQRRNAALLSLRSPLIEVHQRNFNSTIWRRLHQSHVDITASLRSTNIILYGDSLTEGWAGRFLGRYTSYSKGNTKVLAAMRRSLNASVWTFGIAGDFVDDLKYRIEGGELPATLAVGIIGICIGVNNIQHGATTPGALASQIIGLAGEVQQQHPESSVLVLSILPASAYANASDVLHPNISATNKYMSGMLSGMRRLHFVNCSSAFLTPNGRLRTANYIYDASGYLHLNTIGYAAWRACLEPRLRRFLQ